MASSESTADIGSLADLHEAKPTNLRLVEDSDAEGEIAEIYQRFKSRFDRQVVPGILKCFATHPPLAHSMVDLAQNLLFVDGHLSHRQKEMIATLVSSQNACPYCTDSHGYSYRTQGGSAEALSAILSNDLSSIAFNDADRALLRFAEKVNCNSGQITRIDIERLATHGWTEPQIAEAVHIAALFAAFNRIANAFGLKPQDLANRRSIQSSVV